MSSLKVKRLDSPLVRSTDAEPQPLRAEKSAQPRERSKLRRTSDARPQINLERVPVPGADEISTGTEELRALPDPPPLGETLELLSTRLPSSLRHKISDLTAALRARDGRRTSQKALPEQEVLAVLIWLAGSLDDPEAVDRMSDALDTYRARRYAAEARVLSDRATT